MASLNIYATSTGSNAACTRVSPGSLAQAVALGNANTPSGTGLGQGHNLILAGTFYNSALSLSNTNWAGCTVKGVVEIGDTTPAEKWHASIIGAPDASAWVWSSLGMGIYSYAIGTTKPNLCVINGELLAEDTTTPTTPAVGKFGYVNPNLYVNINGADSPLDGVFYAGQQNYPVLVGKDNQSYNNLTLAVANTTVCGAFYANHQVGMNLADSWILHSALHGIYADLSATEGASFTGRNVSVELSKTLISTILKSPLRVKGGGANSILIVENPVLSGGSVGISTSTGDISSATVTGGSITDTTNANTTSSGIRLSYGLPWIINGTTIKNIGSENGSNVNGISLGTNGNIVSNCNISSVRGNGIMMQSNENAVVKNATENIGYKNLSGDDFLYYGGGGTGSSITVRGVGSGNLIARNMSNRDYTGMGINTTGGAGGNKLYSNVALRPMVNGIGEYASGAVTNRNEIAGNLVIHSPSPLNTPAYTGHALHSQDLDNAGDKVSFANNIAFTEIANAAAHSLFINRGSGAISVLLQNNCLSGVPGAVIGRILGISYTTVRELNAALRASSYFGALDGTQASAGIDSIDNNPLLTTDYHLQPTSPCIGAGTAIAGTTTDIEGNQLYPPYNIGPYGIADGALGVAPVTSPGSIKSNLTEISGPGGKLDPAGTYRLADTNAARVAVGFVYGVDHWGYTSAGIPKEILGSVLIDNGIGYRFYVGTRGIAGYSVDQDAKSHAKIVKVLKVNTYYDSLYFDENHEYDWSES